MDGIKSSNLFTIASKRIKKKIRKKFNQAVERVAH